MTDTFRSTVIRRRFRMVHAVLVAGAFAVGTLVVSRLVAAFHEDFSRFYGVSDAEYRALQDVANAQLPLTIGQLTIAVLALFTVCAFVGVERYRLRRLGEMGAACRSRSSRMVVERLSAASLFDAFVVRTSVFGGALLAAWLLQSCVERWLGGFGWNIEYDSWRSILPLASIFGVCVLAGMLVAVVSLVGLRAISVLETALATIARLVYARVGSLRRPARVPTDASRTLRELIGCDILSRPPPQAC